MREHDDFPLSSKKFIAYLISEVTWKLLLLVILLKHEPASVSRTWIIAIVIVAGFVEAGYIGGQAWLDKYVRIAQIAAGRKETDPPKKPKKL